MSKPTLVITPPPPIVTVLAVGQGPAGTTSWAGITDKPDFKTLNGQSLLGVGDIPLVMEAILEVPPTGSTGAVLQKLDIGWHWATVLDAGNVNGIVSGLPPVGYIPAPAEVVPAGAADFMFTAAVYTPTPSFIF